MRLLASSTSFALVLNSWPVILAGFCGFVSTHVTEFVTKRNAAQWLKSGINLGFTTLGGILVTITTVPGYGWKDYLGVIASSWVVSMFTHWTGITTWAQALTENKGLTAKPLIAQPTGTADGTEAGAY